MRKNNLDNLVQLNFELMETLELCLYRIQDFCKKNDIPFYDTGISELLGKATHLIEEINLPIGDDFSHGKKKRFGDGDFTEPNAENDRGDLFAPCSCPRKQLSFS
jgi:hypothetical protein